MDVWMALEQIFFYQSTAKEMKLKFDIQNNRKGNKPMDAYLRELKSMVDALAAINSLLCPQSRFHYKAL
jgi:hypothetical protein